VKLDLATIRDARRGVPPRARSATPADQLSVELEPGAEHAFAYEPHVLAERDRRPPASARLGHGGDERFELAAVHRLLPEVLERVEQVAVEQLRMMSACARR
jgi:hypothetical protein